MKRQGFYIKFVFASFRLRIQQKGLDLDPNLQHFGKRLWDHLIDELVPVFREEADGVHNSLAIVENIVEFRPAVCRDAAQAVFYIWSVLFGSGANICSDPDPELSFNYFELKAITFWSGSGGRFAVMRRRHCFISDPFCSDPARISVQIRIQN